MRVACCPWLIQIKSAHPPLPFDTVVTGMGGVAGQFRIEGLFKATASFTICAMSIDDPLAQMSQEEFEAAMTESRPQVLICSVEFLTSKQVGLSAFPIVEG